MHVAMADNQTNVAIGNECQLQLLTMYTAAAARGYCRDERPILTDWVID